MIARVVPEVAAEQLFDYAVPVGLSALISVGQRVTVPFGNRTISGIVVELGKRRGAAGERNRDHLLPGFQGGSGLKEVQAIDTPEPFLSPFLIRLAFWLAEYYLAPISLTLRCMLPTTLRKGRAREQFYLTPLQGEFKLTPRQAELLQELHRVGGGWLQSLVREFKCSPATLKALAALGAVTLEPRQKRRDPLARRRILPTVPHELMDEQRAALTQLLQAIDSCRACSAPPDVPPSGVPIPPATPGPKPILLLGVTGSGKTEVYLQAIAHCLELGLGAIVLVPEIALTPQTVQRFAGRFGGLIAVLHSALSDGERFDEWQRIRRGEARVVIGPRSALFAPVQRLGLIVVDEEHEPSYKQDETPRYHARDVAVMRGWLEGCAVVLGSATPSMESWLNVNRGKYQVAHMQQRVAARPMPYVKVIDMCRENALEGQVGIFSKQLLEALQVRLERGEQSILFLNRRGYSSSLICPECGYVAECQACNIAYTYHRSGSCLRCHICGAWEHLPRSCPGCGSSAFKYSGFGTQRIESILQKCLPQARLLRMDADVTSRKHSHEELLTIFSSGRADILLGTQMIAKGLDFPNVTLVGVLLADTGLHMPDFRASERTYQLLAQVSGRAGRAELPGQVLIQTYSPRHFAIRAAASDAGYTAFAAQELRERQEGQYPPYSHLICLTFRGRSESKVAFVSENFTCELIKLNTGSRLMISQAVAAPLAKAQEYYRYQVIIRALKVRDATRLLRQLLGEFKLPGDVTLAVDIDALNLI